MVGLIAILQYMLTEQEQARLDEYLEATTADYGHRRWSFIAGGHWWTGGDTPRFSLDYNYWVVLDFLAWRHETGAGVTAGEGITVCGFGAVNARQLSCAHTQRHGGNNIVLPPGERMWPVRRVGKGQVFEITDFGLLLNRHVSELKTDITPLRYLMNVEATRWFQHKHPGLTL